jgi:hypothetical protein
VDVGAVVVGIVDVVVVVVVAGEFAVVVDSVVGYAEKTVVIASAGTAVVEDVVAFDSEIVVPVAEDIPGGDSVLSAVNILVEDVDLDLDPDLEPDLEPDLAVDTPDLDLAYHPVDNPPAAHSHSHLSADHLSPSPYSSSHYQPAHSASHN